MWTGRRAGCWTRVNDYGRPGAARIDDANGRFTRRSRMRRDDFPGEPAAIVAQNGDGLVVECAASERHWKRGCLTQRVGRTSSGSGRRKHRWTTAHAKIDYPGLRRKWNRERFAGNCGAAHPHKLAIPFSAGQPATTAERARGAPCSSEEFQDPRMLATSRRSPARYCRCRSSRAWFR